MVGGRARSKREAARGCWGLEPWSEVVGFSGAGLLGGPAGTTRQSHRPGYIFRDDFDSVGSRFEPGGARRRRDLCQSINQDGGRVMIGKHGVEAIQGTRDADMLRFGDTNFGCSRARFGPVGWFK
jgi:hypothetical protein